MTAAVEAAVDVARSAGHVCWVVQEPEDYAVVAAAILDEGAARGLKPLAFGPSGSPELAALGRHAVVSVDPAQAFLDGGPLTPGLMLQAFREQTQHARVEGYGGVCVVADMDWMQATGASWGEVVAFEARLEAVVHDLGATVMCAYRTSTTSPDAVRGARCVHPAEVGSSEPPPFLVVAGAQGSWRLTGEVDFSCAEALVAALDGLRAHGVPALDLSGLQFVDVAGMRVLARAAGADGAPLALHGVSDWMRRVWSLAGFDLQASAVNVV